FNVKMIDDLVALKKFTAVATKGGTELSIEENPYLLARLLKGINSKATVFLERGTFGQKFWKIEKGRAVPDFTGESLENILQEVKEPAVWQDFSTYLVARRAVQLADRDIETGITAPDAQAAITELEGKHKGFAKLAERVYKYQNSLLVYGQEMGLLSKDLLAKLRKFGDYVPFYRVFNELQAKGFMGSKMADIATPIKRIKGSGRQIVHPIESIVKNTMTYTMLAHRQQVSNALYELSLREGVGSFLERVEPPVVPTKFRLREISGRLRDLFGDENWSDTVEQIRDEKKELVLARLDEAGNLDEVTPEELERITKAQVKK
ncbi:hypothetical protein LCGC14_3166840, partial [marine sediment metagenome]